MYMTMRFHTYHHNNQFEHKNSNLCNIKVKLTDTKREIEDFLKIMFYYQNIGVIKLYYFEILLYKGNQSLLFVKVDSVMMLTSSVTTTSWMFPVFAWEQHNWRKINFMETSNAQMPQINIFPTQSICSTVFFSMTCSYFSYVGLPISLGFAAKQLEA